MPLYSSVNNGLDVLASGEETLSAEFIAVSTISLSSQSLRLTYFTARRSETTTQVRVPSGGTAAAATPTLARIGLYLIATDGGATLVASTTTDTALFAAANTTYTKSWSTPYAKVAGLRYALGVLVVTGVAAPTLNGTGIATTPMGAALALSPRRAAQLAGQADLPSTYTDASLAATGTRFYAQVLP
jgi:hypothetical protein